MRNEAREPVALMRDALEQCFDYPADVFDIPDSDTWTMTVTGRHLKLVRAALASPVSVPPGFALVPVEPTPEMLQAAVKHRYGNAIYKVSIAKVEEEEAREEYAAMLAASGAADTDRLGPSAGIAMLTEVRNG